MKVLHLSAGRMFGGIERCLINMARHARSLKGWEQSFAVCFPGALVEALRDENAKVAVIGPLRARYPWTWWQARQKLTTLIRENAIDALVSHGAWVHALLGGVPAKLAKRSVFWCHDDWKKNAWERLAQRYPAHQVIANSKFTFRSVHGAFGPVPCSILYYPVEIRQKSQAIDQREKLRREWGARGSECVILCASRLETWKGHEVLLEALGKLKPRQDWVAWLVGGAQRRHEQTYLTALKRKTADLGILDRVHFIGFQKDMAPWFAAADIHCQPNTGPEPFGIAFIEAMLFGLPVVTSALGGVTDFITEACGRLLRPKDSSGLAAALAELMDHPTLREQLGRRGSEIARQLCDPAARVEEFSALLDSLFSESIPSLRPAKAVSK